MKFFENEGNDKGFIFCLGSYVGVIFMGIVQAVSFVFSIFALFSMLLDDKPDNSLSLGLPIFLTVITLIGTISFIVNLIWRESINSRMCLFVTQLLLYITVLAGGIILIVLLVIFFLHGETDDDEEPRTESDATSDAIEGGLRVLSAFGAFLVAVFLVIYAVVGALFLRVFKSYLDNLRNRRKSVVINDN